MTVAALTVSLAAAVGITVGRAGAAAGQARLVLLRLTPRAGDTLRMRFEQDVEMSEPVPTAGGRDSTVTRRSAMVVLSHSIIERASTGSAIVTAVTDSVTLSATGADPRALDAARRAMQGRRSRLRVTPTGASEVVAEGGKGPGDEATNAQFPGTLPADSIAIGGTWTREMLLPWGGSSAGRVWGKLAVVFRLDSLAAGGALAHVSMRGALSRGLGPNAEGARAATTGTLTGALLVDLRRGWMVDSRSTFVMTTVVTPPPAKRAPPLRMHLTVTQRLRAM